MAACLGMLAAALGAAPAGALVTRGPHGQVFGIQPRAETYVAAAPEPLRDAEPDVATSTTSTTSSAPTTTSTSKTATATSSSATSSTTTASADQTTTATIQAPLVPMNYHGGPVLRQVNTYAIFWDPGNEAPFPSSFESGVEQYLQDVANASGSPDNQYSVLAQYGDSSGPGTYAQKYGGAYIDTDPYPPDGGAGGCSPGQATPDPPAGYTYCLTDAQVQGELSNVIASNGWPVSTHAIYFVLLPAGIDECETNSAQADDNGCADSNFCSYHSFFGTGQPPLYDVMPWADVPGCQSGYSPNGSGGNDPLDDQLTLMSHEQSETITDPFGNAWWDANGEEVADRCLDPDWFGSLGGVLPDQYNELIDGDQYILQGNYSNDGETCRSRYMAHFTAPQRPALDTNVQFNATGSTDPAAITSYRWSFGDGATTTGPTPTHIYTQDGNYTVTLTTTQADGLSDSVSQQLSVDTITASFTASPTAPSANAPAAFDGLGSVGATMVVNGAPKQLGITSYTWSFGDGTPVQTGETTNHTFSSPGTYTVVLTVRDSAGNTDSTSQLITVGQAQPVGTSATVSGSPTQSTASTSTSTQVVSTPPPPPPHTTLNTSETATVATTQPHITLPGARIIRYGAIKTVRRTAQSGEFVRCPAGADQCTVVATLLGPKGAKVGSARFILAPGHGASVALVLTSACAKTLQTKHHLRVQLQILARVANGVTTNFVGDLTLTVPKAPKSSARARR